MSTRSMVLSSAQLLLSSTPALGSRLFTSSYLSMETVSLSAFVSPTPSTVKDTFPSSSTVIIPTTPDPGTMRKFIVYMTITNRDYDIKYEDKESTEFETLSEEVEDSVKTVLEEVEGFVYSRVERFSEGKSSIDCQMTVFVIKTFSGTEEKIREQLESKIGELVITNVIVVDTLQPTEEPIAKEDVVFEVTLTIKDKEFTEELSNSTSPEFLALAAQLEAVLTSVLEDEVENFLRIVIISFSKGSIICKFNIITEQGSTTSEKDIQNKLTNANENETKGFTFTDITAVKKVASEKPRTGDKETTFPDWLIVVIAAFGAMVLLIFLMIYLVR